MNGIDFDKGFGIGGANRADKTAEDLARFDAQQITGKPQHEPGWLWEPCPLCGDDPVCVTCGYCEKHCTR